MCFHTCCCYCCCCIGNPMHQDDRINSESDQFCSKLRVFLFCFLALTCGYSHPENNPTPCSLWQTQYWYSAVVIWKEHWDIRFLDPHRYTIGRQLPTEPHIPSQWTSLIEHGRCERTQTSHRFLPDTVSLIHMRALSAEFSFRLPKKDWISFWRHGWIHTIQ